MKVFHSWECCMKVFHKKGYRKMAFRMKECHRKGFRRREKDMNKRE